MHIVVTGGTGFIGRAFMRIVIPGWAPGLHPHKKCAEKHRSYWGRS